MKILYAIQGTGNGHLSRANDIIPILQKHGELDLLVSGIQADVSIPFYIKYQMRGMSFIFGKNGGVDIIDTYKKSKIWKFQKDVTSLPVKEYNLIINDFEPVSAWACHMKGVACIGLSHQAAVIGKNSPKPEKTDIIGNFILRHYAPASYEYGFHFRKYDDNIFTPVIRKRIRNQDITDNGHYTVYLPAYGDDKLISTLSEFDGVKWEVFSKHSDVTYREKNLFITPVNNEKFITSMSSGSGVLCGAGFETPAEALYMGKKLMVIPMKNQYEQQCNAASLKELGVPVINSLSNDSLPEIGAWLNSSNSISVDYNNETENIINRIVKAHA